LAIDILYGREKSRRRNPIEILKRLQRESFSDLMKLRDRQDNVERILTFYKSSKGSPFQEASTHIRGEIDALTPLLMIGLNDEDKRDVIRRAQIRSGVHARFTFDTTIRENDTLVTEFVATDKAKAEVDGVSGGPLSLSKVLYAANISNWFSMVAVPVGARCRDVAVPSSSLERGLTENSFHGPPLLSHYNGSAIGLIVKKSKVIASLAQFVPLLENEHSSTENTQHLSTFCQAACKLSSSTNLSLLGLIQMRNISSQPVNVDNFSDESGSLILANQVGNRLNGSIAMVLESEVDENRRIGGWVEMKSSNPGNVEWAVMMTDTPDEELGWGLSLGGLLQGPNNLERVQAEALMKVNFGNKFSLKPSLLYGKDGNTNFAAMMLRSTWSL
jgi:hypothetical protein